MNIYVLPISNIFETGKPKRGFIISTDTKSAKVEELPAYLESQENNIICFDMPSIINFIRENNIKVKSKFTDLFQIIKLASSLPKKEIENRLILNIWGASLSIYKSAEEVKEISNIYKKSRISQITGDELNALIKFTTNLKDIYSNLIQKLKDLNEFERYTKIEKPVNEILLERELHGINFDDQILREKIISNKKDYHKIRKRLRLNYNLLNPHDNSSVVKIIQDLGIGSSLNSDFSFQLLRFLKLNKEKNELIGLLHECRRINQENNILIKLEAGYKDKCFPVFDCMGTITGRILVKEPLLQHLRKTNRDIILPKKGYELVYVDFCQFEPGILADECKDPNLISDYNKGDLYKELSFHIFGTNSNRKLSKIIFLSFIYGIGEDNLVQLIREKNFADDKIDYKVKINDFFNRYKLLKKYKEALEKELIEKSRIGTRLGNYRKRRVTNNKILSYNESRWVLSQRIQGTASIVLKKAILEINSIDKEIEFLLPMHDAVLYQVPKDSVDEKKIIIKKIFESEYQKECPTITPKIEFQNFAKTDIVKKV